MNRFLLSILLIGVVYLTSVSGLFFSKKVQNAQKFKIKQKMFTIGSSFTINDEHNQPAYKVGFKKLSLGQHLHITDPDGKHEYYAIKHVLNPLGLAKYEIRKNNEVFAEVKRKMNLFGGKKFKVKSKLGTFTVEGSFRSREFKIKNDVHLVATVSKKFFALGDQYGVKIEQGQDIPFMLSLAIVVDEVAHD